MDSKVIKIDGQDVKVRVSGATPIFYRKLTGRDLIKDMQGLSAEEVDFEVLGNMAFTMFKQANPEYSGTALDWLDQYSMMGVYSALPELINLWVENQQTTVKSKKK